MSKYRFSLRFLLGMTAAIGGALAMLRYPTNLCFIVAFSGVLAALGMATVGAATSRGALRAFCLGFAIVGWLHLVLAFTTWFGAGTSSALLSRYCLDRLAVPLGYAVGQGAFFDELSLLQALAACRPGSPPALYGKYIVIGQSLSTLFLAAGGGALGQFFYRRSHQDVSHERPVQRV